MISAPDVKFERDEYGQQVHENTQRQCKTRIEEDRLSLAVHYRLNSRKIEQ